MWSGSGKGSGRSSTPYTTVKIAVLAPMPSARVNTATDVNPGLFASIRAAYRRSCQMVLIPYLPALRSYARFLRLFHDATVKQVNCALGEIRVALVVRDHTNCCAVAVQIAKEFHDRFTILRVQVSSRL